MSAATAHLRFLVARMLAHRESPGARAAQRCWGRSADELALYGIGAIDRVRYRPHDADDLAACRRTYEMAPEWVQQRMRPILDEWTTALADETEAEA